MSNFTEAERDRLIRTGMLARCNTTRREFSVGPVETIQRYADCTVFRCPECGGSHDDRMQWGSDVDARMGYRVVRDDGGGLMDGLRWMRWANRADEIEAGR